VKKGFKILLVMFLSAMLLVGCDKKTKEVNEVKLAEDEVIVNGKTYKLNQDETGYGINYKIASNFVFRDTGNALNYYAERNEDNTSDFVIRIFHYKNKSLDYAIKDTVTEYDSKTEVEVNGVKYTKLHFTNYNNANTYLFYYQLKKDIYVFCFTAWQEEERLENIFLNQVVYK